MAMKNPIPKTSQKIQYSSTIMYYDVSTDLGFLSNEHTRRPCQREPENDGELCAQIYKCFYDAKDDEESNATCLRSSDSHRVLRVEYTL